MKLSKEQLLESIKTKFADDTSDETLKFIEDITDTINDMDSGDWENRYKENDAMWRQKYKERFFHTPVEEPTKDDVEEPTEPEVLTYDALLEKI